MPLRTGTKNFISPPLSSAGNWFLLAREHPWVPHRPTAPTWSARTPGQPPFGAPKTGSVVYPRAVASPPANHPDLYPRGGGKKGVQQGFNSADRAIRQRRLSLINPQVDIVMHLDHQHLILLIPSCASACARGSWQCSAPQNLPWSHPVPTKHRGWGVMEVSPSLLLPGPCPEICLFQV